MGGGPSPPGDLEPLPPEVTVSTQPVTAVTAPPVRSWRQAVQEGMRRLTLLALPLIVLFILLPMSHQPAVTASRWSEAGFWLLVATQLAVALGMGLRYYERWIVLVLLFTNLVAMGLMIPTRNRLVPGDLWSPGQWSAPLLAYALAVWPRTTYAIRLLPALTSMAVVELCGPLIFWSTDRSRMADEVVLVQPLWALFAFGNGIALMAERHDLAAEEARIAREVQGVQRAQTEGRREAARILHDHVLHALHAIGQDRALVSSQEAASECRETLEQLDRPTPESRRTSLEALLAADPVVERVAHQVEGSLGPLPSAVAETLAAAAHEAVVNVERHARARHCTISLESFGGDGGRVVVRDDGCGFDPARAPERRLGLQRSVRERLDDIGGQAVITSAPGAGTIVELTWPRPRRGGDTPGLARHTDRTTRRVLVAAALPGLVATAVLMVLMAPLTRPLWPMLLASLAVLALGGWLSRHVVHHALTRLQLALVLAVAGGAWLVNLAVMPPGTRDVYHLWLAWGVTSLVQLTMLTLPNRGAAALGAGLMAALIGGLVVRYGLWDSWHYLNGAATAGAMIVVVGYNAMFAAQHIAAQEVEQTARLERTRDATARMHQLARVEQFWTDRVTDEALPMIRGVAEGTLDPGVPSVRARAREMESSVRDELVMGPAAGMLIEQLAGMRRAGWQVQCSLSQGDTTPVLASAASLLRALGAPCARGQSVTVSTTAGHVNAVVLDASEEQQSMWHRTVSDLGGQMDLDPDFARITLEAR